MRRYWWIPVVIWLAGAYLIFRVGEIGGEEDIFQSVLPLWLLLPIPLLLVWRIAEFFLGIKEGYAEGKRGCRRQTGRCAQCRLQPSRQRQQSLSRVRQRDTDAERMAHLVSHE